MVYQSLYRRYRPRRFGDLRGQDHVVRALHNAVRDDRVGHAYLFSGPRGTGKTSSARILAKALNCELPVDGEPCGECASCLAVEAGTSYDVHELDAASNNGVDAMRDLIDKAMLGTPGRHKVYILDEVHMLSKAAEAALLKTLEEPPSHVIFVLATTDPQKVSSTIISRTQHLQFHLLPIDELEAHLRWVISDAGLDVDDDAVEAVLRQGGGSARDTLSALEQVVAAGGLDVDDAPVDDIVEALIARDSGAALAGVASATAAGRDARALTERLVDQLRDAFLSLFAPDLVEMPSRAAERVADQAKRLGPAATVRALEVLGEALVEFRHASDPRLLLDVALVRLTNPAADTSIEALLTRIERLERAARPATAPAQRPSPAAPEEAPTAPPRTAAPGVSAPSRPPPASGRSSMPPRPSVPATGTATPSTVGEPTPAADPAPADAPPAGELPSRDQLTLAWADHVLPKLRGSARAFYSPGRFLEPEGGTARFALPPNHPRHRCEPLRPEVEAALGAYFGRAVPLELVVDEGQPARPPEAFDDEPIDPAELVDARPADIPSPIEQLAKAFPGAEIIDDAGGPS
jgi:DNA polymerase-3 subunit gamma/tau